MAYSRHDQFKKYFLFTGIILCLLVNPACKTANTKTAAPAGNNAADIKDSWELIAMEHLDEATFRRLYPDKKPTIKLTPEDNRITGHSSCNSFSGSYKHQDALLDFSQPLASTKMACPGEGESIFFQTIKKINGYRLKGKYLELLRDTSVLLRFRKLN